MVPPHPPPCGVVWWWVASLPPPPVVCGVVVGCFPPPSGVVWFGCGLWWFPPFPPLWRGVGWVVPPLHVGSACGVWQTHAHDDIDDDDDDDDNHDHSHNHLSVSLVGRRVSSAHVPADDYRFIDRGGTIFVTVVAE